MWRTIFAMVGFSLLVSACVSAGGGCPPLVAYTAAQERKADDELHDLPKGSQIARMIGDYGKTRAACR
jgi:hypothetical protein